MPVKGFSETTLEFEDGQSNVTPPLDSVMSRGFRPATSLQPGEPLAAQDLNWLFRELFRYANRDVTAYSNGIGLFPTPNSFIQLIAIDRESGDFLMASGHKPGSGVHKLYITNGGSQTLQLGLANSAGDQPVIGGSDVIILGASRLLPGF